MTNVQLYIAIGLPVLAVISSLIMSLIHVSGIRDDMRQMRTEFSGDVRELRNEFLAEFRAVRGYLDAIEKRLDELERTEARHG